MGRILLFFELGLKSGPSSCIIYYLQTGLLVTNRVITKCFMSGMITIIWEGTTFTFMSINCWREKGNSLSFSVKETETEA